jgi:hypothetical protein
MIESMRPVVSRILARSSLSAVSIGAGEDAVAGGTSSWRSMAARRSCNWAAAGGNVLINLSTLLDTKLGRISMTSFFVLHVLSLPFEVFKL